MATEIRPLPPWINIDDVTCSKVQTASLRNAFSQMVDIAEVAYFRTSAGRMRQSVSPRDAAVVGRTFETYFIFSQVVGARDRLTKLIGRRFWMEGCVRYYVADESTSGYLNDIKNLASNPIPTVTIVCSDSYLTKSTVDEFGNPLPDGKYEEVS